MPTSPKATCSMLSRFTMTSSYESCSPAPELMGRMSGYPTLKHIFLYFSLLAPPIADQSYLGRITRNPAVIGACGSECD